MRGLATYYATIKKGENMTVSNKKQRLNKLAVPFFTDLLSSVQIKKQSLVINGRLEAKQTSLTRAELALIGTHSGFTALFPVVFEEKKNIEKEEQVDGSKSQQEKKRYTWTAVIQAAPLIKRMMIEATGADVLSARLIVYPDQETAPSVFSISLPAPSMDFFKELRLSYGKQTALLSTTVSEEGFLKVGASFIIKEALKNSPVFPLAALLPVRKTDTSIWIMGNDPFEIGENSWALFEQARKQKDKDVYYVLSSDSPGWKAAHRKAGDALLAFNSPDYVDKLQQAEKIITEKAPYHLYPSFSPVWDRRIIGEKIILPSYPLGISNEKWTINRHDVPWKIDGVVVSSKPEKRFVHETLGYLDEQIFLTGLPSQEFLATQKREPEHLLILLPSLKEKKEYDHAEERPSPLLSLAQTDAFQRWIMEQKLDVLVLLTKEDADLKKAYKEAGTKTTTLSSFEKEYWLTKAKVLITDEHPAALEFSQLGRPVLFFQPEKDKRFSSTGHAVTERRYQNELPGEIAETEEQILHLLQQLSEDQFKMSRKNQKKAKALFEFPPMDAEKRMLESFRSTAETNDINEK